MSAQDTPLLDVAIVGSGFSGLCMAIKLKEAGIHNIRILEKASEVGGTWRENTYPGAACDVQSHLYSYSFAGKSDWSHVFSGWEEIQNYILDCAARYGLKNHIQFNTTVTGAQFNELDGSWIISTADGEPIHTRCLILGTGPLHVPAIPSIPGLASFTGEVFHSSQWNHDYDLTGKSVASIGTGGSAIQYVPEVAKKAAKLHVFQRTPAWVMPRNERAYTRLEKVLFRKVPVLRKAYRSMLYWINESRVTLMLNPRIAKLMEGLARLHLRFKVKDPVTRQKLTPDYTIGCKRILISNQYYPAFNRENVELVTDGIQGIRKNSIVTADGEERPVDAIILGTGFVADPCQYMKHFPITGLNGQPLLDTWKDGAEAYLGMSVSGFPNLFQMVGPNTGLGHNSMIFMIESQSRYIVDAITHLKAKGMGHMDIRADIQRDFNAGLQKKLVGTVWQTGCQSWYKRADGKNFTLWPGTTFRYRWETRKIKPEYYSWAENKNSPLPRKTEKEEALSL